MRSTLLVAACALASASCITHRPVRTFDEVNHTSPHSPCMVGVQFEDTSIAKLQAQTTDGDKEREKVACVSEEHHGDSFKLHVFEFDDDGVPWNRQQQSASLEALASQLHQQPALVFVFVHGWKNDASVCNGNISCFREMLEVLSKSESAMAAASGAPVRQVIGVYVGWRGGTIGVKGLNALTFWSRKHTAHVIGDNGAVTALIARLRGIVSDSEYRPKPGERANPTSSYTSLVFVGHSFGGALLFSALATSLNADVGAALQLSAQTTTGAPVSARAEQARPVISEEPVQITSRGDLVVLVNPAMEASRFANLAYTRNLVFKPEQLPIFMTLASEADWAVGGFFPIGQAFGTVSRAARSRDYWFRMDKGFGLYEPYHTHRLVMSPTKARPKADSVSGECRCKSNLAAFGDDLIKNLRPFYDQIRNPGSPESMKLAAYLETLYSRLEPARDVDPNNPFVMASVDPAVVGGHSDIFNPAFTDFLLEYVIRSEIKRRGTNAYPGKELAR